MVTFETIYWGKKKQRLLVHVSPMIAFKAKVRGTLKVYEKVDNNSRLKYYFGYPNSSLV